MIKCFWQQNIAHDDVCVLTINLIQSTVRWPWQNEEVVVEVNAGRHVISANELATVCQKLLASGRAGGSCFAWTFLAYFFVSKTKKKVQGLGRKAPYS